MYHRQRNLKVPRGTTPRPQRHGERPVADWGYFPFATEATVVSRPEPRWTPTRRLTVVVFVAVGSSGDRYSFHAVGADACDAALRLTPGERIRFEGHLVKAPAPRGGRRAGGSSSRFDDGRATYIESNSFSRC